MKRCTECNGIILIIRPTDKNVDDFLICQDCGTKWTLDAKEELCNKKLKR